MLRAVTAGLICLILGIQSSKKLDKRVYALRVWQQTLDKISTQCACLRLPPADILQDVPQQRDALTPEEQAWIEECLQAVLHGTQEEQERQLRYVIKRMEKALERAEEKQKQDAKLFLSLGLLGGLCILLLCL